MVKIQRHPWPEFAINQSAITDTDLDAADFAGCDLEFNPTTLKPYMGGGSVLRPDGSTKTFSSPWSDAQHFYLRALDRDLPLIGHWLINADRPALEQELGIKLKPHQILDTLLLTFLCHQALVKTSKEKTDDGQIRFTRGAGYLDLYSCSTLSHSFPNWKICSGPDCLSARLPCPEHNELGYNAMDSHVLPTMARDRLEEMQRKSIPFSLYEHLRDQTLLFSRMRAQGVKVDLQYVSSLQTELEDRKAQLFYTETVPRYHKTTGRLLDKPGVEWNSPFNPRSPDGIRKWFKAQGVELKTTHRDYLAAVTGRLKGLPREWMDKLIDWKLEGKDLSSWFSPEYFDHQGYCHPVWQIHGASTMRPSASSPSMYNIPKRGFAKSLRRGIVAPPGFNISRADSKQVELRMMMYLAGVDPKDMGYDAFDWIVQQGKGVFERLAAVTTDSYLKKPRNAAKSLVHAADYGEGLKLEVGAVLEMPRAKREIAAGALKVHWDWEVGGKVVCFTGYNLAARIFGSATYEHRRQALEIQELYFREFPMIRRLQRKILDQIAESGWTQAVTGSRLDLYEDLEANCKDGLAFHGQHCATIFAQRGMMAFEQADYLPYLNIHDETAILTPVEMPPKQVYELMQTMTGPFKFQGIDEFSCPVDIFTGPNYLDAFRIKSDGSLVEEL